MLEDAIVETLLGLKGVDEAPSQFAESTALWADGREIVHFHDERVEIRLTRKEIRARRQTLSTDARVAVRSGDWVSVRLASEDDSWLVLELARAAIDANRSAGSARATPSDEEIMGRRRRHGGRADDA